MSHRPTAKKPRSHPPSPSDIGTQTEQSRRHIEHTFRIPLTLPVRELPPSDDELEFRPISSARRPRAQTLDELDDFVPSLGTVPGQSVSPNLDVEHSQNILTQPPPPPLPPRLPPSLKCDQSDNINPIRLRLRLRHAPLNQDLSDTEHESCSDVESRSPPSSAKASDTLLLRLRRETLVPHQQQGDDSTGRRRLFETPQSNCPPKDSPSGSTTSAIRKDCSMHNDSEDLPTQPPHPPSLEKKHIDDAIHLRRSPSLSTNRASSDSEDDSCSAPTPPTPAKEESEDNWMIHATCEEERNSTCDDSPPRENSILVPEACADSVSQEKGDSPPGKTTISVPETCVDNPSQDKDEFVPETCEELAPATCADSPTQEDDEFVPETCEEQAGGTSADSPCQEDNELVPETCEELQTCDEVVPETPLPPTQTNDQLRGDDNTSGEDSPPVGFTTSAASPIPSVEEAPGFSGFKTAGGRKIPSAPNPFGEGNTTSRDSPPVGFANARGLPIPRAETPSKFSGFTTSKGRQLPAARNPFAKNNSNLVTSGRPSGFTMGNGRKVTGSGQEDGTRDESSAGLEAIFVRAKKLSHRRPLRAKRRIRFETSQTPPTGKQIETPAPLQKPPSSFPTAAGRQLETPARPPKEDGSEISTRRERRLDTSTGGFSTTGMSLFSTASGKAVKSLVARDGIFESNARVVRTLPFENPSTAKESDKLRLPLRRLSLVTPQHQGGDLTSRRRLFETPRSNCRPKGTSPDSKPCAVQEAASPNNKVVDSPPLPTSLNDENTDDLRRASYLSSNEDVCDSQDDSCSVPASPTPAKEGSEDNWVLPETCEEDGLGACDGSPSSEKDVIIPETCEEFANTCDDEEVPETPIAATARKSQLVGDDNASEDDSPRVGFTNAAGGPSAKADEPRALSGFATARGRKIPAQPNPFNEGDTKGDSPPVAFAAARGLATPKEPLSGFTTGKGRRVAAAPNPFAEGDATGGGGLSGFTTAKRRKVMEPLQAADEGSTDLEAIFAKARKLSHRGPLKPKRRISFETPNVPSLFVTAGGRQLRTPNAPSLFATARGRQLDTSALPPSCGVGSDFTAKTSLFSTGNGKQLKTPIESDKVFGSKAPVVRTLPFDSAPTAKATDKAPLHVRRTSLVTPHAANDSASRRRLFETPPANARGGRGGSLSGGSKPFKRPRRIAPANQPKAKDATKATNNVEMFFPVASLPRLSITGRLLPPGTTKVAALDDHEVLRLTIDNPTNGAEYLFLRMRFGEVDRLPKAVTDYCRFDSINTFGVDDCVSLLNHVFPAAAGKAVTRLGSDAWTRMSYGLAVWKLCRLECERNAQTRATAEHLFLTAANVLRELWRRVVREWTQNSTPHLAQMLRRDASPRSHAVLLVCDVLIDERRVLLEVTDGWYICRLKPDMLLSARTIAKRLDVGDKVHIFEAELVAATAEPFFFGDADEMGAHLLAPSANCVKKAGADAKLGMRRRPLFTRTAAGAHRKGGKCPGMQAVVLRAYPTFFIESHEVNAPPTFRRREAEERAHEAHLAAGSGKPRNVTRALDVTVCGLRDDPMCARSNLRVRIYRPGEEAAALLAREGAAVQLPALRQTGASWTALGAAVRALRTPPTWRAPRRYRFAVSVRDLHEMHVGTGADFDGAYVLLHVGAAAEGADAHHAYLADGVDGRLLVLALAGADAIHVPRALAPRRGAGGDLAVVALRDVRMQGADAGLRFVRAATTLRSELLTARAARRRGDLQYLREALAGAERLVAEQAAGLELLREAVESFSAGERTTVASYFSSTQDD